MPKQSVTAAAAGPAPLIPADAPRITATVEEISDHGEGLVTESGRVIFVPEAVSGDVITVAAGEPFAAGSSRCPGRIVALVSPSPWRGSDYCTAPASCGGCALRHYSPEGARELKAQRLRQVLEQSGITITPEPFTAAPRRGLICRRKSIRYLGLDAAGRIVGGFYRARSHDLVSVPCCPLEPLWFAPALAAVADILNAAPQAVRRGARALLLRDLGEVEGRPARLLVLVMAGEPPADLLAALVARGTELGIAGIYCNINPASGNQVLGPRTLVLGPERVPMILMGRKFMVGPGTFVQVNPEAAELLYREAVDFCAEVAGEGEREALDLFCGIGTMTLPLAGKFARVTGVEVVGEAVAAAAENARENGITNARFVAADATVYLKRHNLREVAAVISDPPRRGLGEEIIARLGTLPQGARLALVYCALKALSRDLGAILAAGFVVRRVRGYDFFEHSLQQETLVLLEKTAP